MTREERPSDPPAASPVVAKSTLATPTPVLPAPNRKGTDPTERSFTSLVELGKHGKTVTDLEYSSSGLGVATASLSGSAVLWILAGDQHKYRTFDAGDEREPMQAIAYHGESRRLVTPWGKQSMALWDSSLGKTLDVVPHAHQTIRALEISPDGRWLVAAGEVGVSRWEITKEGKLVERGPILAEMPMVSAVAFSPVAEWVGAVSWSGEQFIWDYRRKQFVGRWRYAPAQYPALSFGRDRLEWTWCTSEGRIAPLSLVDRLSPSESDFNMEWSPTCLDYAARRRMIGVGGAEDGAVHFINLETREVSRIATGIRSPVNCLKFSPTEDRVAVGLTNGQVFVAGLPTEMFPPPVSDEEGRRDRAAFAKEQMRATLAPLLRTRESKP